MDTSNLARRLTGVNRNAMTAFAVISVDWLGPPRLLHVRKLTEHPIHAALIPIVILEAFIRLVKQPAALIVPAFTLSVFA